MQNQSVAPTKPTLRWMNPKLQNGCEAKLSIGCEIYGGAWLYMAGRVYKPGFKLEWIRSHCTEVSTVYRHIVAAQIYVWYHQGGVGGYADFGLPASLFTISCTIFRTSSFWIEPNLFDDPPRYLSTFFSESTSCSYKSCKSLDCWGSKDKYDIPRVLNKVFATS